MNAQAVQEEKSIKLEQRWCTADTHDALCARLKSCDDPDGFQRPSRRATIRLPLDRAELEPAVRVAARMVIANVSVSTGAIRFKAPWNGACRRGQLAQNW
jgi:hypothetical protein